MFGNAGFGRASTPLLSSIEDGDLVAFTKLLEGDGSNASKTDFKKVLGPICEWHRVEMLRLVDTKCVGFGASSFGARGGLVGARGGLGASLLHTCANHGAVACATFLLNKGIDHTVKSDGVFGLTALDCCRKNGEMKPTKGFGDNETIPGSEPSPSKKQIEQLILAKMTTEEKSQDAQQHVRKRIVVARDAQQQGGFSFS